MAAMAQLLLHRRFHVLALQTSASRPAAVAGTVAFAVFFEAVAFLAFTFCAVLACANQEELFLVAAAEALAVIGARQTLLEAFAVILLAAGFAAEASS